MNGRAAVNVLQTAYSLIQLEARECISARDIEWVLLNGRYTCRMKPPRMAKGEVGSVNGIGVLQNGEGVMLRIEAVVKKVEEGGELKVTGIIEEEEFEKGRGHVTRKSMILNSIENILTVLKIRYNIKVQQYFVHIDFNSSIPIDGPSAGLSLFIALYSALFEKVVPAYIAMTGAISITGEICPVGGIYEKALAAKQMGIKKLIIPKENKQKLLETIGIEIIPVETIEEVIHILFDDLVVQEANTILHA